MKKWLKGGLVGSAIGFVLFIFFMIVWASMIPKLSSLTPPSGYSKVIWVIIALFFFNPIVGFIIGSIYAKIRYK